MPRIGVQEINASSMADIAFLLLIFFLVTTTMDVDTGIARQLPPIPTKDQKIEQDINKRNLFPVKINAQDRLLVNGRPMNIDQLKDKAKEFVKNEFNSPDLPEREEVMIPGINKPVMVSKGIISLQNDRGTTYGRYIEVQDRLVAAYNELRDEAAFMYFGKRKYDDLTVDEQEAIKQVYPLRISEAEPKNLGGAN